MLCYIRVMATDTIDNRVEDGAIALPRPARPGSFTGLMTLYESNFVRLGWLVSDPAADVGLRQSSVGDDCPLYLELLENCRYTTTVRLTYLFEDADQEIADPDVTIRISQDAHMAEAMSCVNQRRHAALSGFKTGVGSQLERRWARNNMLNKWLEYCADKGHRFDPVSA